MRFFTYGSFKPGHERWPILEPWATKVERAYALGTLYDLGAYPGARFSGDGRIPGYLVHTADEPTLLESIDAIEGHPILFCRRNIKVLAAADQYDAYGYEFVHAIHLNKEAEIYEWKPEKDEVLV